MMVANQAGSDGLLAARRPLVSLGTEDQELHSYSNMVRMSARWHIAITAGPRSGKADASLALLRSLIRHRGVLISTWQ